MSQEFKKALIVVIAVMGVALIGIVAYQYQVNSPNAFEQIKGEKEVVSQTSKEMELPKPTGKIEDVVSATIAGVESEAKALSEEETQVQSIIDDSSEVSDLGKIYDENEIQ